MLKRYSMEAVETVTWGVIANTILSETAGDDAFRFMYIDLDSKKSKV